MQGFISQTSVVHSQFTSHVLTKVHAVRRHRSMNLLAGRGHLMSTGCVIFRKILENPLRVTSLKPVGNWLMPTCKHYAREN